MMTSPHIGRLFSAVLLAVGVMAATESAAWHGAGFPGFFVMPNRVVPSIALPGWSGVAEGRPLYQHVILAVDGVKTAGPGDVYQAAARHRAGDDVEYTVARDGAIESRVLPLRTFGTGEYLAIFGLYFLSGACYLALAALAVERRASNPTLHGGLAAVAWAGAAFALTAMDLYGPGRLFRVHAAAEALLPAAFAHLALVCPRDHLARRPGLLPLVYGVGCAWMVVYEVFLYDPRAYSVVHNAAQGLVVVPVLALTAMLALARSDALPDGVRVVRPLLVGSFIGILGPAIVLGISGVSGGSVPVNACAWVSFVFPLAAMFAVRSGASQPA